MKKMPEPQRYYLLLLAALFARFSLGTDNITKSGCLGDSIELFENISLNNDDTVVSLYKNGIENTLIAMWSMQDSFRNSTLINGYNHKLFLDKYGNIWIIKLLMSDEAKYTLRVAVGKERKNYGVQLVVLVAPTIFCKPKITRLDNVLTVDLEANECGKPVASVYWLNHSGFSFEGTKAIKLQQGNEEGIYHACIEGDALRCVKSPKSSGYCSFYKVNVEETSQSQEDAIKSRNKTVQEQASPDLEGDVKIRNIKEQGDIPSESSMTKITILMAAMFSLFAVMTIILFLCLLMIKKKMRTKYPGSTHIENEPMMDDKAQQCSKGIEVQSRDKEKAQTQTVKSDPTPGGIDLIVDGRVHQSYPRVELPSPDKEEPQIIQGDYVPEQRGPELGRPGHVGNNTATEETLHGQNRPANRKTNVAEGEPAHLRDKHLSEATTGGDQPSTAGDGSERNETNAANEKSTSEKETKLYQLKIVEVAEAVGQKNQYEAEKTL